ncbi:MAG TPA: hypothetical protein VG055_23440 [Planctomycetaceae bacterium]|jgi:uncharacterized membrane protein YeaQ/YmgE (transglycosylase-associated protein family)|nr:hypothetical protein [Planctomycetaceae bacterium]
MLGTLSWLTCGIAAGFFVNQLVSGYDKGIVLLTLGVGVAGAMVGGFGASLFHLGDSATFSFYAVLSALVCASIALVSYRRILKI